MKGTDLYDQLYSFQPMNITDATLDYIRSHRDEDVRTLALRGQRSPDVDLTFALQQIDGWQRARTKLPMWAGHEGVIYPPHISMEQCSSEQTARYKAEAVLPDEMDVFIDLTGGFGVDFSYMSQRARKAIYVEQQKHLCEIAEHNFKVLRMGNAEVKNADGMDVLCSLPQKTDGRKTVIYLDPARRDTNGRKTYAIEDCTPDIVTLWPTLREKADMVVVKLSPMLDHHEALRLLPGINEVHIVSVKNECKELLLCCDTTKTADDNGVMIHCVNDEQDFCYRHAANGVSNTTVSDGISAGDTILLPNASVMKAGCFGILSERFGVAALDNDSHIFCAKNADFIGDFPGKAFIVHAIFSMNKRELKQALAGITHANIAVRNFKLRAEELRKRLKLKDGGEWYIFGTSVMGQQTLLLCKKS